MKFKVLERQKVIWSLETRETTVEVDGKKITVRYSEHDNGADIWGSVNDGALIESYKIKDPEIKEIVENIAYNISYGLFDNEGDEFDFSELSDDETA
jgi:hypothetical protein